MYHRHRTARIDQCTDIHNTFACTLRRRDQEGLALLDPIKKFSTTTSGDTPQASAPVNTTHMTLANSGLGARAEDDTAVVMEDEGQEGEQDRMAGGGAGQHTTRASKEMTQEAPDIALAEEETPILSVSLHDTLTDNLTNNSLGARAKDDAAVAMEGGFMSQGEEGGQSRMVGGGAGQHTTGASKTSGTMSSGGPNMLTCTSLGTLCGRSSKSGSKELPCYRAGRSQTNVNSATSTLGTPAEAATQTTSQSAGCKRPSPDWR